MSGYKLSLTPEGSNALREFAASIPVTIDNIVADTEQLNRVYQSTAEDLGVHSNSFAQLLLSIKKAQELAADAILALPPMLESCAVSIDQDVANNPTI